MLDLFAGTGSLGIEALSRGARAATFVESERRALVALRANLSDLGLEGVSRVIPREVRRALSRLAAEQAGFDLILADPPWGGGWIDTFARGSALAGVLRPGGVTILERPVREPAPERLGALVRSDSRAWGETRFDWYRRGEEETA